MFLSVFWLLTKQLMLLLINVAYSLLMKASLSTTIEIVCLLDLLLVKLRILEFVVFKKMKPLLMRSRISSLSLWSLIVPLKDKIVSTITQTSRINLKFLCNFLLLSAIDFHVVSKISIVLNVDGDILRRHFRREKITLRFLQFIWLIDSSQTKLLLDLIIRRFLRKIIVSTWWFKETALRSEAAFSS
jgi:hypothetical protein